MAQLNLYVPDELAERLKAEALREGMPLSRYVVSQLTASRMDEWPPGYFENACGFLKGDFPDIAPLPAEPLSDLDSFG